MKLLEKEILMGTTRDPFLVEISKKRKYDGWHKRSIFGWNF